MRGKFPASHNVRIIPEYVQWALVDISEQTPFINRAARNLSPDLRRCSDAIILGVQSGMIRASGGFDD